MLTASSASVSSSTTTTTTTTTPTTPTITVYLEPEDISSGSVDDSLQHGSFTFGLFQVFETFIKAQRKFW